MSTPSPTNGQPPVAGESSNGKHESSAAPAAAPLNTEAPAEDSSEMFKNDPLIQKALKIFEGEIRSVQGPS